MQRYWILCIVCFLVWCAVLSWLHLCAVNVKKRSSENLSSADIAVVLGNAVNRRGKPNPCLRSRVEAGVRLYRQGRVGKLLMSGGTDDDGSNEAQTMRDMAVEMGVPTEKIRLEEHSESTYENIVLSVPKLRDASEIIIVSDAFHLARASWLAKRYWQGKTVELYASGACGDSMLNYLRKLSREVLAWVKAVALYS